ncbi:hypothetical protein [Streptomyces sp. DH12]|uniref:hypothetical protein n=1 Tax=Streptomyces sp. DH12 TaxID=2857010 RepID=UPI001E58382D|nr:hypothetical protein [Streptomyces sp. DH12]
MPTSTILPALPWFLAAALFLASEVRDRASRGGGRRGGVPAPAGVRWPRAGAFTGAALAGAVLGGLVGPGLHPAWAALHAIASLVVFIALTRFLGRSPGAGATTALSAPAAAFSFLLPGCLA